MKIKQLVMSVMLLLTLSILCGCTISENHYGTEMKTINIIAYQDAWYVNNDVPMGSEGYYMYQDFSFPEIDNSVLNNGAVLVYYIDRDYKDNILPLVIPYVKGQYVVVENVRYECESGRLRIIIESSDFTTTPRNRDMPFKVCILSK